MGNIYQSSLFRTYVCPDTSATNVFDFDCHWKFFLCKFVFIDPMKFEAWPYHIPYSYISMSSLAKNFIYVELKKLKAQLHIKPLY